jgi:sec-independent protein translocase protein TatB
MFDVGFQELLLIGAAAVICIPPKDLPGTLRSVVGFARKAKEMASDFSRTMHEAANQADLGDIKRQLHEITDIRAPDVLDPNGEIRAELSGQPREPVALEDNAAADPMIRDRPTKVFDHAS